MGILNVTPDSFSDGGRFLDARRAVTHALRMEREGADLIDVGGESTRPGARPVPAAEEIRRVLPVVERLAGRLKIPISVDTCKPEVARAALKAGAGLVNDVTGLRDREMAEVVAEAGVPVILMHMRGTPRTMKHLSRYRRLLPEVLSELRRMIERAAARGMRRQQILLDPGIGFAKTPQQNLVLLNELQRFRALGHPIVVGPSRKSFIGQVLALPPQERGWGTAAAVALAVARGADIVRVHDVGPMRQVIAVTEAILRAGRS